MPTLPRIAVLTLLALGVTGFPRPATPTPAAGKVAAESPLTVVVVDDPELGKAIAREWLARTEQELKLLDVTAQETRIESWFPAADVTEAFLRSR